MRMSAIRRFAEDPRLADKPNENWDAVALGKLKWVTWNDVFRDALGSSSVASFSELQDGRNKRAHQERSSATMRTGRWILRCGASLAYQLGGKSAFERIRATMRASPNPGDARTAAEPRPLPHLDR